MSTLLLAEVFPPQTGGSGRWLWELYRRLPDGDVRVMAGHAPGEAQFDRSSVLPITRAPLHLSNWGVSHPRSATQYLRALMTVRRLMSSRRPTEIHCGKCLPEGLLAAALKRLWGIPYMTYVHGEELTL